MTLPFLSFILQVVECPSYMIIRKGNILKSLNDLDLPSSCSSSGFDGLEFVAAV